MLSSVSRASQRQAAQLVRRRQLGPYQSNRLLNITSSPKRSRTWKNTALRWTLAAGAVYFYNTANVFAEEPTYAPLRPPQLDEVPPALPTLDDVAAKRKQSSPSALADNNQSSKAVDPHTQITPSSEGASQPQTAEEYEEEASNEGAFNPETGEINWDCPCLGGMAHGPCGEEFKAAFSCFVYSKEEPKGMDCIDRFKNMQDCFRQHPEVYGDMAADDEEGQETVPNDSIPGEDSQQALQEEHTAQPQEHTKTKKEAGNAPSASIDNTRPSPQAVNSKQDDLGNGNKEEKVS